MGRIVVGVDGSEHSIEALRFALAEGRARGADVQAVITWSMPAVTDAFGTSGLAGIDPQIFADGAKLLLDQAVDAATDDADERAAIVRSVIEGSAGHVLVELSRGADLLVVGSRGHGGFAGLLLGSVSNQCVHHAHCPVTVIRPEGGH